MPNPNPRIKPIERATGRSWDHWLAFMEGIGASSLTHHEIATKVLEQLMGEMDNPAWWAQSTTAAYEQEIGRSVPGQRPDGTFQTSKSKATKLGMVPLIEAWTAFAADDESVRAVCPDEPRVGGTDKRRTWRTRSCDGSIVNVISEPKKNGTASIVVQHMGLATLELNAEAKERWAAILERFASRL